MTAFDEFLALAADPSAGKRRLMIALDALDASEINDYRAAVAAHRASLDDAAGRLGSVYEDAAYVAAPDHLYLLPAGVSPAQAKDLADDAWIAYDTACAACRGARLAAEVLAYGEPTEAERAERAESLRSAAMAVIAAEAEGIREDYLAARMASWERARAESRARFEAGEYQ